MKTDLLTSALELANRGWAVFPLHTPVNGKCSCPKKEQCDRSGKHPRTAHGLKD
jgi:hypothetical protein